MPDIPDVPKKRTYFTTPLSPSPDEPKGHLVMNVQVPDDAPVPQAVVCRPCAELAQRAGCRLVLETPVTPATPCAHCRQSIHRRATDPAASWIS
jgi:hypothetical protein